MTVNADNILKEVLLASIKEQKAKRRWGIFFKLVFLSMILIGLWLLFFQDRFLGLSKVKANNNAYVALININGMISAGSVSSADNIIEGIQTAIKDKNVKGIILRINSPGGTPVQASEIYREIVRQESLHPNINIYATCTDMCTSAAYYIASGTKAIYTDPASIVGSIGVLLDGFGFTDSLNKLGIQRRLITAGKHKGFLDPFSPVNNNDQAIAQHMLDQVHQQFIHAVIQGRGQRLKIMPDTFSGLAWTGQEALSQGLIDGFGSVDEIARNLLKTDNIQDFTVKPSPLDLFAEHMGEAFVVNIQTFLNHLHIV